MQLAMETKTRQRETMYRILFAISLVHLLNDSVQSVIPAIFPILKESMQLTYLQLGMIGFALNMTSSIMQPVVGLYSDRKPSPYLPPLGMVATFFGMLGLAFAPNFWFVLLSVILVGIGSAVFHPEGSRIAYMSAGPRRGLAQSIYQVGGNFGQSLAPLITALIFVPLGQVGALWFTIAAALAILILLYIASWYKEQLPYFRPASARLSHPEEGRQKRKNLRFAILLLILLVFVRSWYHVGISTYYAFYLIEEYGISIEKAQTYIFLFLIAGVAGTFLGGPLADRFGKRNILLFSLLGSAPFALLLPHVNAFWAYPVCLILGFILLSSFSVTVVYAQDLFPGKVGTVSGLIVGLAFGMGALGSVALGNLADWIGIKQMIILCGFLPLFGIFTMYLPSDRKLKELNQ